MGIAAAIGVLSPFPFYYWLWTSPQTWVALCGKGRDPCKVMAYVAHFLKLIQFLSLFSVSTISWPPPLYFWPLIAFGQFINFRLVLLVIMFPYADMFFIVVVLETILLSIYCYFDKILGLFGCEICEVFGRW